MRAFSLSSLALSVVCFPGTAAETITLTHATRPAQVLNVEIKSDVSQKINIIGDEELIRQHAANGTVFPHQLTTSDQQSYRWTSGPAAPDGSYFVTLDFLKAQSHTVDRLGYAIPFDTPSSKMVGMSLKAQVLPDGETRFHSLDGGKLSPELRNFAPKIYAALFEQLKGIKATELKTGEPVTDETELSFPLPNLPPVALIAKTTFSLVSVSEGIARISLSFTYGLKPGDNAGVSIAAQGAGYGVMLYDVANQHMRSMNSQNSLQMVATYGKARIENSMQMRQVTAQTLVRSR